MAFGKSKADEAAEQGRDPRLDVVREAARAAQIARLPIFTAELNLPSDLFGLAIVQVEQHGFRLDAWAVDQGVGYPVFRRT